MTDDEAVQYGREAAAVVGNRAYQDAYDAVERAIVNELAQDITPERAQELRLTLICGRRYRKYLERAMADGKFVMESQEQKKWWRG